MSVHKRSLRYDIRRVVDAAERRLAQREILAKLRGGVKHNVFCVTIAHMLRDGQLSRRKITKAIRALNPGVRFVYGPGLRPVEDVMYARAPRKMVGFMELARQKVARRVRA